LRVAFIAAGLAREMAVPFAEVVNSRSAAAAASSADPTTVRYTALAPESLQGFLEELMRCDMPRL